MCVGVDCELRVASLSLSLALATCLLLQVLWYLLAWSLATCIYAPATLIPYIPYIGEGAKVKTPINKTGWTNRIFFIQHHIKFINSII